MRPAAILRRGATLLVRLTASTVSKGGAAPQTATYNLNSDGSVTSNNGAFLEYWNNQPFTTGSYWVRATLTAGTAPSSGTMGTWLNLGTSRSWSNTDSSPSSTITSTITFDIASDSGGANIVASASVVIQANTV